MMQSSLRVGIGADVRDSMGCAGESLARMWMRLHGPANGRRYRFQATVDVTSSSACRPCRSKRSRSLPGSSCGPRPRRSAHAGKALVRRAGSGGGGGGGGGGAAARPGPMHSCGPANGRRYQKQMPALSGHLKNRGAGRTLLTTLGGTTFVAANAPLTGSGHPWGECYNHPTLLQPGIRIARPACGHLSTWPRLFTARKRHVDGFRNCRFELSQ
jgi:hypothetical protein